MASATAKLKPVAAKVAAKPNAPAPVPPKDNAAAAPAAEPLKAAPAEAKAPEKPIVALMPNEIWARESGVKFNTWEVVPVAGTPFDHLLRREFWNNVSQKMRPGDTIIAYPRDGAWYGQLIVWDAGQNFANVTGGCQQRPKFDAAPGVLSDFEIGRDPIDGVIVRRISTGEKVRGNFTDHEDARRWIISTQQTLKQR